MNIHFDDYSLFTDLNYLSAEPILIGSHVYGTNDENSDVDYLYIYVDKSQSFLWEHHQLQYKEKNVDYNFTSLQGFIRNALTGDSTINLEVLFSKEILNTKLAFLAKYKDDFVNYNIIKSYLGMAKRDLKSWKKDTSNGTRNIKENAKKLSHFYRGVVFAKMLLEGDFDPSMNGTFTIPSFESDIFVLNTIKSGSDLAYKDLVDYVESIMESLRIQLNERLETKGISRFMNPKIMKELDHKVKKYVDSFADSTKPDYGMLFYDALENGVRY